MCNISVKSVTQGQFTHGNLDCNRLKDNSKFSKPMISLKIMTKIFCGKVFSIAKNTLRENLPALPPREVFMFILIISNHTVFLVQFGIDLHLWVFQKAHSSKFNSKLSFKAYDYPYQLCRKKCQWGSMSYIFF